MIKKNKKSKIKKEKNKKNSLLSHLSFSVVGFSLGLEGQPVGFFNGRFEVEHHGGFEVPRRTAARGSGLEHEGRGC